MRMRFVIRRLIIMARSDFDALGLRRNVMCWAPTLTSCGSTANPKIAHHALRSLNSCIDHELPACRPRCLLLQLHERVVACHFMWAAKFRKREMHAIGGPSLLRISQARFNLLLYGGCAQDGSPATGPVSLSTP